MRERTIASHLVRAALRGASDAQAMHALLMDHTPPSEDTA